MSNIAYYGAIIGWLWYYGFNIMLVLIFSIVTFILTQREQDKTKKVKDEVDQWKQKAKDEELKNRVKTLASQISEFLGDRQKNDPAYDSLWRDGNLSENQKHTEWDKHTKRMLEYSNETMTIYNVKYLPDVTRIRQEFLERNLTDENLERSYHHPTNPLGIEAIVVSLHNLAARLP